MGNSTAPSDVGRRIRSRREVIGASLEATAARAGIDPGYLHYLETSTTPDPTRGTVLRLASALGTSPAVLLGGNQIPSPASLTDRQPAVLVELERATCMNLIEQRSVGRAVFVDVRGPVALPVNYRVVEGDIVFRTEHSTSIAAGSGRRRISFEVDVVDDVFEEGWSVLVSGTARPVDAPEELARAFPLRPWAGGERASYFRLEPELVTGRELRHQRKEQPDPGSGSGGALG
ncbi:MAG TPA: pyridoxamine 5'-phosphate oxidase family protein [Acidimicrobiales bacterium]|nr:pyridoxamine 5'-phosphate oxidase family protein [Acidimicrobiales bacterium]